MHKKTTLQRFTVFLFKTMLLFVLSFAFLVTSAQNLNEQSQNARKKSPVVTATPVNQAGLTKAMIMA